MTLLTIDDPRHGLRYAVEFEIHGKPYITKWTSSREEACVWSRIIQQHGYSITADRHSIYAHGARLMEPKELNDKDRAEFPTERDLEETLVPLLREAIKNHQRADLVFFGLWGIIGGAAWTVFLSLWANL